MIPARFAIDDPYSLGSDEIRFRIRQEFGMSCAVVAPRMLVNPMLIAGPSSWSQLVVVDPARRWPSSWREFARQLVDIVRHEFWMAQGRPERSPGASWV